MKKLYKYWIASIAMGLFVAITFNSCEKKVYEIGTPTSKLDGINGAWNISAVTQIDEASPLKDEMDLSRFFIAPGEPALSLTFNSSDFTYTVIPGTGKNPFGESGKWAFDDVNYPSNVSLYSLTGDTVVMGLGRTIRPTDSSLFLNQQRTCEGTPVTTYQYIFDRK